MALGLTFDQTRSLIGSLALLGAVILAYFVMFPPQSLGGLTYAQQTLCIEEMPVLQAMQAHLICTVNCSSLVMGGQPIPKT